VWITTYLNKKRKKTVLMGISSKKWPKTTHYNGRMKRETVEKKVTTNPST
jgi:hypothetical protein